MNSFEKLLHDLQRADEGMVLLLMLLVAAAIVFDAVTKIVKLRRERSGLARGQVPLSLDGSNELPPRTYRSAKLGLAGTPDAILREGKYIIPVEVKPFARKLRDRYVAQLLVYLRLVEEFEGVRPPHGYLILGKNHRRVKIDNTPQRQAWLDRLLVEMRAGVTGAAVRPAPHPEKCRRCTVRQHCSVRSDIAPALVSIEASR